MKLSGQEVLVCDCGATMDIDGAKLEKACSAAGGCTQATSLCRDQIDRYEAALEATDGASLIVACTQERAARQSPKIWANLFPTSSISANLPAGARTPAPSRRWPRCCAWPPRSTPGAQPDADLDRAMPIYADGAHGNGVEAAMAFAGALKATALA